MCEANTENVKLHLELQKVLIKDSLNGKEQFLIDGINSDSNDENFTKSINPLPADTTVQHYRKVSKDDLQNLDLMVVPGFKTHQHTNTPTHQHYNIILL